MDFLFVKLDSILQWRRDAKKSVWMKVPVSQSYLIPVAFFHGFNYHHAVGNYAMLLKWLPQQITCNVPPYASHQIGVAGIGVLKLILLLGCYSWPARNQCNAVFFSGMVLNEEKNEVLVIQDKHQVTLLLLKHFLTLHNFLKKLVTPSDLRIILVEEA